MDEAWILELESSLRMCILNYSIGCDDCQASSSKLTISDFQSFWFNWKVQMVWSIEFMLSIVSGSLNLWVFAFRQAGRILDTLDEWSEEQWIETSLASSMRFESSCVGRLRITTYYIMSLEPRFLLAPLSFWLPLNRNGIHKHMEGGKCYNFLTDTSAIARTLPVQCAIWCHHKCWERAWL